MSEENTPTEGHGWDDDAALDALLQVADLRFEQALRSSLNLPRGLESILRPESPPRAKPLGISNGLPMGDGHPASWPPATSPTTASSIVATQMRVPVRTATTRPTRMAEEPQLGKEDIALLATIASGVTADVAARRLELSSRTLRRRLRNICNRLGVNTPIQAVVWAARRQLI